ncbi:unnamed protein product [Durusdinium trenchii]|uniref:Uncharacterized protein n=2 Tax=Durusdinium trenchii TaxID=1381693 RepID=A0ABP0Q418_9DINO
MLPGKKRAAVEMGSTAHPYAAQRQEQILKEIKAEAEALCRLYGKSLEEMTDSFKSFKSPNCKRRFFTQTDFKVRSKALPPVFKRPERTFFPYAPTLVGASGLGQGPGNYCHQEIGGTAERRRHIEEDDQELPPSRGSQASERSRPATCVVRAKSACDMARPCSSKRSVSSALLRQEIQKAVLQEVSRSSTPQRVS